MNIQDLPAGSAPEALTFGHFPTRHQAVIFRNWNAVPAERLARVLKCSAGDIVAAGRAMGLEPDERFTAMWAGRGFITTIRRNWHLLDYPQLLTLLDWSADRLAFTLKEEDFLYHKLGCLKPVCGEVVFRKLSPDEVRRTEKLRERILAVRGKLGAEREPWRFLRNYGRAAETFPHGEKSFGMRLAHSYSALYGDALLDPALDPYPDAMLADCAKAGVNAVWMQATLYTFVPWLGTDEYSAGAAQRCEALKKLTERAARHGVRIYLYINEPRNMPESFFEKHHPEWRGVADAAGGGYALCTSVPGVLEALRDGMSELFRKVPGLGGVFAITMSENLTHCHSRNPGNTLCPRCAGREVWSFPVAVNRAIAEGVHKVAPDADVIAHTWAWADEWAEKAVRELPADVKVMCVSEWHLPTMAGGVAGSVVDYSMSQTGPSEYARGIWRAARETGHETVAKVQMNCTWEGSFVPYLPVPSLVEEHLDKLRRENVRHLMVAWSLGGWPGGNLPLADVSTGELARKRYGGDAERALAAQKLFADGFREFPFNSTGLLYDGPQNYGPAALFYPKATGYHASMIGYPYDDINTWSGNAHYPEEVLEHQFELLSGRWREGLAALGEERGNDAFEELRTMAEACYCHYRSTYNHIRFVRRRNAGNIAALPEILDEERALAMRLAAIQDSDDRIGFEASNHYYYWRGELMEKILCCDFIEAELCSGNGSRR